MKYKVKYLNKDYDFKSIQEIRDFFVDTKNSEWGVTEEYINFCDFLFDLKFGEEELCFIEGDDEIYVLVETIEEEQKDFSNLDIYTYIEKIGSSLKNWEKVKNIFNELSRSSEKHNSYVIDNLFDLASVFQKECSDLQIKLEKAIKKKYQI